MAMQSIVLRVHYFTISSLCVEIFQMNNGFTAVTLTKTDADESPLT